MSWEDDDDFEQQLMEYSEIETLPKEQFEATLPRTIQQYQQRIQSNNSTSIFDADYSLDVPSSNSHLGSTKEVTQKPDEDVGVFKGEKVTYIISGRGRGGRNIVIKPGQPSSKVLNDDEEVRQLIRKVAPIGYANEITESAVRAHKMAKVLEENSTNVTPSISKSSSPVILKSDTPPASSTPVASAATSEPECSSPSSSKVITNLLPVKSPILSGKSTPCTTTSDVASSEYFTSQDGNVSSSSKINQTGDSNKKSDQSYGEHSETSAASANGATPSTEPEGAVEIKPLPLSQMLKRSREAHKKRELGQKDGLANGYSKQNYADELASQRKIEDILRQDRLELEKRKYWSDQSSNSSSGSRDETLSWRRRTNSPPRFAWGQLDRKKESKELNIDSFKDFPALK